MSTEILRNKIIQEVPNLRFQEFTAPWEKEEIGKHVNLLSGFAFKGEDISEDPSGLPILRGINITEGRIRHSLEIDRYYCGYQNKLQKYIVKEGDLVLGMDGSKVGKNVAIISKEDSNSLLIQRVASLRPKKSASIQFIYHHIFSPRFHRYVDIVNTSSGIPHISSQQIKEFKIYFPSLPEQEKIASFLTAVDKKIQQLTRKKELLETYKKGVMQQLFSQEIRFKDEDGKDFPEWENKSLGEIALFSKGKGISKNDINSEGTTPCIRYGELYTHYKETIDIIDSKTNLLINDLILSEAGDVIIPASGETRIDIATASCVLNEGIALGGDLNIIRGNFNGVFMAYYLNAHMKTDIANLSQGSSVMHLYAAQLKQLKLEIPNIEEQQKIADFLSAIDKKIEEVSQQITQTQSFKKGLLQQMFV